MVGYIYILWNPVMPHYVKIGYSNDVKRRLKEFNTSTEVADAFRVYATYAVNRANADRVLHKIIDMLDPELRSAPVVDGKHRHKEFFKISKEQAFTILESLAVVSSTEDRLTKYSEDGSFRPVNLSRYHDKFIKSIDCALVDSDNLFDVPLSVNSLVSKDASSLSVVSEPKSEVVNSFSKESFAVTDSSDFEFDDEHIYLPKFGFIFELSNSKKNLAKTFIDEWYLYSMQFSQSPRFRCDVTGKFYNRILTFANKYTGNVFFVHDSFLEDNIQFWIHCFSCRSIYFDLCCRSFFTLFDSYCAGKFSSTDVLGRYHYSVLYYFGVLTLDEIIPFLVYNPRSHALFDLEIKSEHDLSFDLRVLRETLIVDKVMPFFDKLRGEFYHEFKYPNGDTSAYIFDLRSAVPDILKRVSRYKETPYTPSYLKSSFDEMYDSWKRGVVTLENFSDWCRCSKADVLQKIKLYEIQLMENAW